MGNVRPKIGDGMLLLGGICLMGAPTVFPHLSETAGQILFWGGLGGMVIYAAFRWGGWALGLVAGEHGATSSGAYVGRDNSGVQQVFHGPVTVNHGTATANRATLEASTDGRIDASGAEIPADIGFTVAKADTGGHIQMPGLKITKTADGHKIEYGPQSMIGGTSPAVVEPHMMSPDQRAIVDQIAAEYRAANPDKTDIEDGSGWIPLGPIIERLAEMKQPFTLARPKGGISNVTLISPAGHYAGIGGDYAELKLDNVAVVGFRNGVLADHGKLDAKDVLVVAPDTPIPARMPKHMKEDE
jgi:hypothetical protein